MATAVTTKTLVEMLLTARSTKDVDALLERMQDLGLNGRRPIGDRDNNAGTIEIASNPYSALGERVTNSMDALLELEAVTRGYEQIEDWPVAPTSPRDAARTLLGVPKTGTGDLTEKERRALAAGLK